MKNLIIGIVVVLVLAGIGFGAYFLLSQKPEPSLKLTINKPDQVLVGQSFDVSVSFSNNTEKTLTTGRVSLIIPTGVIFAGRDPSLRVLEQTVDNVGPGNISQVQFSLLALEGQNSVKNLTAKMVYRWQGGETSFESSADADLQIGRSSANLSLAIPPKVFSGENFDVAVSYQNNTEQDLKDVFVRLEYPPVFQFVRSSVDPTAGNNYWRIGDLAKGESGSIAISGFMIAQPSTNFTFNGSLGNSVASQKYELANQQANIAIASSPLTLQIEADKTVNLGKSVTYVLTYKNNSAVVMNDLIIKAKLIGDLYDLATVRTDGQLDSVNNVITWNTASTSALRSIAPGKTGNVKFLVSTKKNYPITRLSDKNFVLTVEGQIESPTVPSGTVADKTMSTAKVDTKVTGKTEFIVKGIYKEPGVLNSGPYPPKVNQPTQYTVHFIINNYSTDLSAAKVVSFLPAGTKFLGVIRANTQNKPVYNLTTGELDWDIGVIAAGSGVVTDPIEAMIQVENTPAANQMGTNITLVKNPKFTAHDEFIGTDLSLTARNVDTSLRDDPGLSGTSTRTIGQ